MLRHRRRFRILSVFRPKPASRCGKTHVAKWLQNRLEVVAGNRHAAIGVRTCAFRGRFIVIRVKIRLRLLKKTTAV